MEPKPTLDEEKQQPQGEENEIDIDGLMSELESAGVSNREQLQGKLKASREAGQLAQMLGQQRQQNEELKQMIQQLQAQPRQQSQPEYDEYDQKPIDLEQSIERSVDRVLSRREKQQAEIEQRINSQWAKISGDADFEYVKGVWDERVKDPSFIMQVRLGAIDPVDVYHEDVRKFYKGLALKSATALKQLKGGGPAPPHLEEKGEVSKGLPREKTETEEILTSYKEKVNKGGHLNEQEELDALMRALGG